jgi:hypothetical protein
MRSFFINVKSNHCFHKPHDVGLWKYKLLKSLIITKAFVDDSPGCRYAPFAGNLLYGGALVLASVYFVLFW